MRQRPSTLLQTAKMWLDGGLCLTTCEHLQPTICLESNVQAAYMETHP